jgi:repressor LexA
MNPTAESLRAHRKRVGLSQHDLAKRAGLAQSAYSRFETGTRRPSLEQLRAVAKALGVGTAELLGESPAHDRPQAVDALVVPLLGEIPAGAPSAVEAVAETYPVLRHQAGRERYVLRARGHSMSPEIKHGDLILVEYLENARPEDVQGRICVCSLNGESTMKRVFVERRGTRTSVVLRGDNPEVEPIVTAESDELTILGRVIAVVGRDL